MAGNILQKYLWLLDELTTFRALSLSEIKRLWSKSVHSEGKELSDRTFHHFKEGIRDTFHIDIECSPSGGDYLYSIKETDSKYKTTFLRSMLMNYHINNSEYLKGKVVDLDAGMEETLFYVLRLIENKTVIGFSYLYSSDTSNMYLHYENFMPLALVHANETWFLIGVFCEDSGPLKIKGTTAVYQLLSCINSIRILREQSDFKTKFDLQNYIEQFSNKDKQFNLKSYVPGSYCDYIFYDDSEYFMECLWMVNSYGKILDDTTYENVGKRNIIDYEDWMKR